MIDVNLVGPLYFVRVAVAYLKHNKQPTDDKSILLFSSVAGFYDSPGLFAYGVRISSLPIKQTTLESHKQTDSIFGPGFQTRRLRPHAMPTPLSSTHVRNPRQRHCPFRHCNRHAPTSNHKWLSEDRRSCQYTGTSCRSHIGRRGRIS